MVDYEDSAEHSTLVTAVEGGINYWADVIEYRWNRPDWFATVVDREDDGRVVYMLDQERVRSGMRALCEPLSDKVKAGSVVDRTRRCLLGYVANDFEFGDRDYISYLDADVADVVVQYALFGECVYG